MKRPENGETFTAKIDRISGSGNGIIELDKGFINIGPVKEGSEDVEIEAEMITNSFARCLTESVKTPNYDFEFLKLSDHLLPEISSDTSDSSHGIQTNSDIEYCDECGKIMYVNEGLWECKGCGYRKPAHTDKHHLKRQSSTEGSTDQEEANHPEDHSTRIEENDTDLDELREEAEKSAVEQVPKGTSTTRDQTPEYTRSSKIRQYVKARANGYCEGCGDPAPFTSRTGDPYLHAHHIHELNDGGSDTPDTVIALCPNCHYRVHHGEDGGEYNQELLEVVQGLEQ